METLALEYPLVDSLNQVILFLTSYSCQNIMGGASVRNAAGLEMGGATAAISHLGLQSPSGDSSTPAGTTPRTQHQALV